MYKIIKFDHSNEATCTKQYFPVMLFIRPCILVLSIDSKRNPHSSQSLRAALFHSAAANFFKLLLVYGICYLLELDI